MYSIDFIKLETHGKLSFYCSDFWAPYDQRRLHIKKTERSDTTILGILGTLGILGISGLSGLGTLGNLGIYSHAEFNTQICLLFPGGRAQDFNL
jgi:hypothetical protein